MKPVFLALLFFMLLPVLGCHRSPPESQNLQIEDGLSSMQAEIDELKTQVEDAEYETEGLAEVIQELQELNQSLSKALTDRDERLVALELAIIRQTSKEIGIDPTTSKFSISDIGIGKLLVSFIDAEPYLDGFKVILHIGNPNAAKIEGLTINANWSSEKSFKKDSNEADKITGNFPGSAMAARDNMINATTPQRANKKWRKFSITDVLNPGSWTKVSINVTPATAEEIKTLRLLLDATTVSLRKVSE
jgi:hypothetical protein